MVDPSTLAPPVNPLPHVYHPPMLNVEDIALDIVLNYTEEVWEIGGRTALLGEVVTVWHRDRFSLTLRKSYPGGPQQPVSTTPPTMFFVYHILSESIDANNVAKIHAYQLCQFPGEGISMSVGQRRNEQRTLYQRQCAGWGVDPNRWSEELPEASLEAPTEDNAWDTFVAQHPAAKEEA